MAAVIIDCGYLDTIPRLPKSKEVSIRIGPRRVEFLTDDAVLNDHTYYFESAKERDFTSKRAKRYRYSFPLYHPHAFYRVMEFMYTGDYSVEGSRLDIDEEDDDDLLKHPRVSAIAHHFNIEDLKYLCAAKYSAQLAAKWACATFVNSIEEVYTTTSDSDNRMRKVIIGIVKTNMKELFRQDDFLALVKKNARFSAELIRSIMDEFAVELRQIVL